MFERVEVRVRNVWGFGRLGGEAYFVLCLQDLYRDVLVHCWFGLGQSGMCIPRIPHLSVKGAVSVLVSLMMVGTVR
jgi:hypothetical protein